MDLLPGQEIRSAPRIMTRERMRWYVDALPTVEANDGRIHRGGPTIHDDDDYALGQGLPGIIADGMVSTNWILDLMLRAFGPAVLEDPGALTTKFIAPVYEDVPVTTVLRVEAVAELPEARRRLTLKVWAEDDAGKVLTFGSAAVTLPRG
ncbi:acyl dehydratase [Humitalea rosea]|uniref:Acyl dehydratase n=1 Tax=Humitalea rosea TaxID=990373 RepID=A0A2W7JF25_9PROT|nr:MaoC family dehydratase [Humitalea rosea]PZW51087.1 acyl dehydratase [Humitalea rosea]